MMIPSSPEELKACCANLYESDLARVLLGDSFHPGGLALTERLGTLVGLASESLVLDLACGRGDSALHLARTFGCRVLAVDLGRENVEYARLAAAQSGLAELVTVQVADAERLALDSASFDVVICECAFCTFPDKTAAAAEIARVLRPGGRFGLSDLTRSGPLGSGLETLLAWLACIADARSIDDYVAHLTGVGLTITSVESHDEALVSMVRDIQGRLLGVELAIALKKLELPGVDLAIARQTARAAMDAARTGLLGYAIIVAEKAS